MVKIKLMYFPKETTEKDFPNIIGNHGFICKKFTLKKLKQLEKKNKLDYPFDIGKPDFILYKGGKMFFCEFKSNQDGFRINQLTWALNNSRVNIIWAIAENQEAIGKEREIYVEDEEENYVLNNYNKLMKSILLKIKQNETN